MTDRSKDPLNSPKLPYHMRTRVAYVLVQPVLVHDDNETLRPGHVQEAQMVPFDELEAHVKDMKDNLLERYNAECITRASL